MPALFRQITDSLRVEIAKHRNRPFLEAAMAASASIAIADGVVSYSERSRVDAILEKLDELRIFDPHTAIDLFNDYVEVLTSDGEAGWTQVRGIVVRFSGKQEAELLIRIALAMSFADGEFSPQERTRVRELCDALSLAPELFDL
jgi:tellurite resistance protein TerB